MDAQTTSFLLAILILLPLMSSCVIFVNTSYNYIYVAKADGYAYIVMFNGSLLYRHYYINGTFKILSCNNVSVYLELYPTYSKVITFIIRSNRVYVLSSAFIELPIIWRFHGYIYVYSANSAPEVKAQLKFRLVYSNGQSFNIGYLKLQYRLLLPESIRKVSNFTISCIMRPKRFNPFYPLLLANSSKIINVIESGSVVYFASIPIEFNISKNGNLTEVCAYSSIHIGAPYVRELSMPFLKLCISSVGRNIISAIATACLNGPKSLLKFLDKVNGSIVTYVCSRCVSVKGLESFVLLPDNLVGCYRKEYPVTLYYVPIPSYCYPKLLKDLVAQQGLLVLVVKDFKYVYPSHFNPYTIPFRISAKENNSSSSGSWLIVALIVGVAIAIISIKVIKK